MVEPQPAAIEAGIHAVCGDQLPVAAPFDQPTGVEDDDLVGCLGSREPVAMR